MNRVLRLSLAGAGLCLAGSAWAHHTIQPGITVTAPRPASLKTAAHSVSLTGRVVDAGCYMAGGATSRPADCSGTIAECRPMALISNTGKLYLLTASTRNGSAYESCRTAGESRVQLVGYVRERNGFRAFEVIELKPMKMASR